MGQEWATFPYIIGCNPFAWQVPYPNNLLRNTALRSVRTDYVFVVDVDMTSSGSLYHDFLEFAGRQSLFDSKKGQ